MTRKPIMIMGCTSDAGKSFLVAALCRHFADRGLRVAPFKAQNMSNNAAVTTEGLEIGRAQYFQAIAARTIPQARMNPVLLKPSAPTASQVIVLGKYDQSIGEMPWMERKTVLWPIVKKALQTLRDDFDQVVIEGAGSPAEINLRQGDIVNMSVALECGAEVYLVADIDRGGAFAHLLGTWNCLEPAEQDARVDRADIVELARGADVASADDQRMAPPERRLHLLDGEVELPVQILHAIRAHRRVGDLLGGHGWTI